MIAFQKYSLANCASSDKSINYLPRCGTAVDVIAKKDLHRPDRTVLLHIGIDLLQQRAEQIVATVYVANDIDALPLWDPRSGTMGRKGH
jgi:hypothetical protein